MSDITDTFFILLLGLGLLVYGILWAITHEQLRKTRAYLRTIDCEDDCEKWLREQKVLYE